MAQGFLTPTIIAKEALIALENNLVFGGLVHRAYSPEYANIGATLKIRTPFTFSTVHEMGTATDSSITAQTIAESSISVVMDKLMDVSFEVFERELTLDIVSFRNQCIEPAMRAHAQSLDAAIAAKYVDIAAYATVSTGTPVVRDVADIREQLNLNKVPFGDRCVVVSPESETEYIVLDAFLHAEKRGDTKALKEASMGRVFGMDWYMDQNIATHDTDFATAVGTIPAGVATAATVAAITGLKGNATAASITLTVGDVFKITGETLEKGHVIVTASSAATAGTVTATFAPAIQSSAASGAAVTFEKDHLANLALHKDAIALVTAPLAMPLGGAKGGVETYKGLSCRVVYDYDMTYKKNVVSIDMLYGLKVLNRELACRLVHCT